MTLKERIASDITAAMKSGNSQTVSVLRMVRARILDKEVELRTQKGRDYQLSDEETVTVVFSYAKQRQQSIDSFRQAGREEMAAREEEELSLLQNYLPQQLTEEEIERLVQKAISDTGASGPKDMGLVMKSVMPKLQGVADGKLVNEVVRRRLADN